MRGKIALLATLLVGLLAPAAEAITIPPTQEETTTSNVRGQVRKIIVDSDGGEVRVQAGSPSSVRRTERWVYERPSVRVTFTRSGLLAVRSRCPDRPLNNCSVDILANITRTATVLVVTETGGVRINDIESPSVVGRTSNGRVQMNRVSADEVKATTSNGDVAVRVSGTLSATELRTNNGNIAAIVPRGAYAMNVHVDNGYVYMSGVRNRGNAARRLFARTNNGDITISGR